MKRARYRVQDPLTFPGEPPASYRLSEWRKVDRDPGTRMPRWACYWLRHGHRAQLAGYIWVNDPRVLQVRYAAYGPLGGMIESTQHHGRSMMTGGTVRRARARVDAILMGGFVWDPQEPDRAVLSPALAASYDDGCRPLPAPPVRPPSSAPSRLPGPELWREEGLFPGRAAGAPRRPGLRVAVRSKRIQAIGNWAPTLYGARAQAAFTRRERLALRSLFPRWDAGKGLAAMVE